MVSVNLSGLEKNPGFSLTLPFIRKAVFAMMYGDIIVNVANQVRPYEVEQGKADAMIAHWSQTVSYTHLEGTVKLYAFDYGLTTGNLEEAGWA